ncbi:hypothetical protein DGI_3317 [Megalodesulfovibrio gigas DSM 1382 = ATCC 19364]|uniref:Uncharacterized protein n=2 Tax=Megalodesulfovibrio gigas TaxID=879 RepID=T2GG93_MEGG1|nr:hypothetical protein DGI_3317 [Megalodesulfovibrio gigas DSM 1382 = ATCC 19364]
MTGQTSQRVGGGGAATSAGILFQQRLGALIGCKLLAQRPLPAILELGDATPVWMRFETEASVDDMLIATSADGFVAIQAKTDVSLSSDPVSPLGKTIAQFVRLWLACLSGDGTRQWKRPLDPHLDRLVLAVGPTAPKTVVLTLANALRLASQPGGGALNKEQTKAFSQFSAVVESTWKSTTSAPLEHGFANTLAGLVRIFQFDPASLEQEAAAVFQAFDTPHTAHARALVAGLVALCGELMAQRGGVDFTTLRRDLFARGLTLPSPPNFKRDIERLRNHSAETAKMLERYETIEAADGQPVTIKRECEEAILAAALEGPFLIVGEPGAGKSGVLNALARELRARKHDVLELAVDRHSVETLEGLKNELELEHGLIETLDAWDGAGPGWLIIDALDAARGDKEEGVFRKLIERIMERKGRWRVIASIRTFDLRMGQQYRTLFKGAPPAADFQAQGFQTVRHVQVPSWSPTEFQKLLDQTPALQAALKHAPPALRDLAAVPFNTRLLCELIKDGLVTADFSHIASQTALLKLYWDHRVNALGAPAKACIHRMVHEMVEGRVLRAAFSTAAGSEPATVDALKRKGVLVSINGDRQIQFRHHVLFDYAVSREYLDPEQLVDGSLSFPKADARGLMLAPALAFVLHEIWDADQTRARFWTAAARILADGNGDPVIRGATGRICAEYPLSPSDVAILAQRAVKADDLAVQALVHLSGALAIRLEDHPETPLAPWVRLLRDLAANVSPVSEVMRFLLLCFLGKVSDEQERADLGIAARALLDHALTLDEPRNLVIAAINFVGGTYDTDPEVSRCLLERVFDPARLERFAPEEVPALCRRIKEIATHDPAFARQIYQHVFAYVVTDDRETMLGDSQILALRSNARQDYESACHALTEFVPTFLALHPKEAVDAILEATEAYVARENPRKSEWLDVSITLESRTVRLREDWSYIWASDPDQESRDDGEALVKTLLDYLRSSDATAARPVVECLVEKASLAIFWSRLFMVASERRDEVLDLVLPLAMQEAFLTLPDTWRDAVDAVAAGYDRLSESARRDFETGVPAFDFSRLQSPDGARESFERWLFGAIGRERLLTDHARSVVDEPKAADDVRNERLYTIHSIDGSPKPYDWILELDRDLPANQSLMAAIDTVEDQLELERDAREATPVPLQETLDVLERLASTIDRDAQHPDLVDHAEGQIARALDRLIERKETPRAEDPVSTTRLIDLFTLVATSQGPQTEEDTEANFERGASWGSPAPRVDAAKLALALSRGRPDLYSALALRIDALLQDPHPAVRLMAALYLPRISALDTEGFWRRLSARFDVETNLGVLDHVMPDVLCRFVPHAPDRVLQLALGLLGRFADAPDKQARMRKSLANSLTILWVTHERQAAHAVIDGWIAMPTEHLPELCNVLGTLRKALVLGLDGKANEDTEQNAIRHRSQALVHAVAQAADGGLADYFAIKKPDEAAQEQGRAMARLLDAVCHELYYASGASHTDQEAEPALGGAGLRLFFDEIADTLEIIGNHATPHTVYNLLNLLEFLRPFDAARAFDLTAHALLGGGRKTGYQFESLGADQFVKLIGIFLADHKQLFEEEGRRGLLINCLDMFMNAGWPAARRLLYCLPELLQ